MGQGIVGPRASSRLLEVMLAAELDRLATCSGAPAGLRLRVLMRMVDQAGADATTCRHR